MSNLAITTSEKGISVQTDNETPLYYPKNSIAAHFYEESRLQLFSALENRMIAEGFPVTINETEITAENAQELIDNFFKSGGGSSFSKNIPEEEIILRESKSG
jgi:hypothetical protein